MTEDYVKHPVLEDNLALGNGQTSAKPFRIDPKYHLLTIPVESDGRDLFGEIPGHACKDMRMEWLLEQQVENRPGDFIASALPRSILILQSFFWSGEVWL